MRSFRRRAWSRAQSLFVILTAACCRQSATASTNYSRFLPIIDAEDYSNSTSYRRDRCRDRYDVLHGKVDVQDVLKGTVLSVVMLKEFYDEMYMLYSVEEERFVSGYMLDVLEAVAIEGDFEVLPVIVAGLQKDETWTNWLFAHVEQADLTSIWFMDTSQRRMGGVHFPFWFMDMSLQMVVEVPSEDDPFKLIELFNFLAPFTWKVWLLILVGTILTALLVWIFERGENPEMFPEPRNKSAVHGIARSVWHGGTLFTQSGNWEPVTPLGRLFTWSWSMVVLVLVASYSAKLTSSLIQQDAGDSPLESMTDAVETSAKVCVMNKTGPAQMTSYLYPKANIIEVEEGDLFDQLLTSTCDAGVGGLNEMETTDIKSDRTCAIQEAGGTLKKFGGSFAVPMDSTHLCTSIVSQAIAAIMTKLEEDQVLSELWSKHVETIRQDATCTYNGDGTADDDNSVQPVGMNELSGVILLHFIVVVAASTFYVGSKDRNVRQYSSHVLTKVMRPRLSRSEGSRNLNVTRHRHISRPRFRLSRVARVDDSRGQSTPDTTVHSTARDPTGRSSASMKGHARNNRSHSSDSANAGHYPSRNVALRRSREVPTSPGWLSHDDEQHPPLTTRGSLLRTMSSRGRSSSKVVISDVPRRRSFCARNDDELQPDT